MSTQDYDRLVKALRSYAYHAPLDVTPPAALQRDLLAIAGAAHTHVASIGSDRCLLCHLGQSHPVHVPTRFVPGSKGPHPRPSYHRQAEGLRAENVLEDDARKPPLETCPKCQRTAMAFICSEPGCPVNGGAAYEENVLPLSTLEALNGDDPEAAA